MHPGDTHRGHLMKGNGRKTLIAVAAALLMAVCAFAVTEASESDGFVGSVTISNISLQVNEDGLCEWSVTAYGWTEKQEISYIVSLNGEELYTKTGMVSANETFRFDNNSMPIWKGSEYTITVMADQFHYAKRAYVTLSGIYLTGSQSMEVGEKNVLQLSTAPSDASCSRMVWESSDPSIATVVDGVVSATDVGTVYISATSAENASISSTGFKVVITDSSETSGYRIEVTSSDGGTAKAEKSRAFPGEWVELEKTADWGYEFIDWETNTPLTIIDEYAAFKMPAYAVKIKAIFRETYPIDTAVRETDNGMILIPLTLIESKGMRDDENLKASIDLATEVPSNIPKTSTTYTVSISYNGVGITNLGDTITVILDYKSTGASDPAVYSVSADGTEVYKLAGTHSAATGTITFHTGKLTLFAVSSEPIEPATVQDSSVTYVFIVAAFIIALAGVFIFFRR